MTASERQILDVLKRDYPSIFRAFRGDVAAQHEFLALIKKHLVVEKTVKKEGDELLVARANQLSNEVGVLRRALLARESTIHFLEQLLLKIHEGRHSFSGYSVSEGVAKLFEEVATNIEVCETETKIIEGDAYRPLREYITRHKSDVDDIKMVLERVVDAIGNVNVQHQHAVREAEKHRQLVLAQMQAGRSAAPPPPGGVRDLGDLSKLANSTTMGKSRGGR